MYLLALVMFLVLAPDPARAQTPCDGSPVARISIDAGRPPFAGSARKWQVVARALGLHHATTRDDVIRAYLLVKPGDACTNERLAESERVLRSLPFLAAAQVTARTDSSGNVVVDVRTTDEVPVLVNGSLRHGVPSALSLGNENVGGLGLRMLAGIARGDPYRNTIRGEIADYAIFGFPVVAVGQAERGWLGGYAGLDVTHPFLSNLQRGGWHASYYTGHDFPIVLRPTGDNEAVDVRRRRWSASGVFRSRVGGLATLFGPILIGARSIPGQRILLVTDSGAVAAQDSIVSTRLKPIRGTWAGAMFALRRVHYVERTGLDALFATQDVMTGWQAGFVAAPGFGPAHTTLFATSASAGFAVSRFVAGTDAEVELRTPAGASTDEHYSSVANVHTAAYFTPTSRVTLSVRDNLSRLRHAWIPTQLSLGDPIGGPRGYIGSSLAGGVRNMVRTELRWSTPAAMHRADIGAAVFFDAAQMRAGDVPYGAASSAQSIGFSLLAAYPPRSKRVYRLDLAMPLQRVGSRGRGLEVRFVSGDPGLAMSMEPGDVTQARLAPVPSSLFTWPERR